MFSHNKTIGVVFSNVSMTYYQRRNLGVIQGLEYVGESYFICAIKYLVNYQKIQALAFFTVYVAQFMQGKYTGKLHSAFLTGTELIE